MFQMFQSLETFETTHHHEAHEGHEGFIHFILSNFVLPSTLLRACFAIFVVSLLLFNSVDSASRW